MISEEVKVDEKVILQYEMKPEEVVNILPLSFLQTNNIQNPREGFKEATLRVPIIGRDKEILFELSFDGESELLATIKQKPLTIGDDEAEEHFENFLGISASDEDDEDEDDGDEEGDDEEDED